MMTFTNARIVTLAGPTRPRVGSELTELGIIDSGSLVVDRGKIIAVGDVPPHGEVVDLGGRLLLPGFVDAHTHLVFGGCRASEFEQRCQGRSYQEIAVAGGGILSSVRATRECSLVELLEAGKRHAGWMLTNGTTTAEAKSGYGLSAKAEIAQLEAAAAVGKQTSLRVVPTFLGLHAVPPEFEGLRDAYVSLVCETLLPAVARGKLAKYVDAFIEEGYFSHEDARRYAAVANANGLRLRLHVDQLSDGRGAELAAELGATTADHLEHTSSNGIAALAEADVQPVLLPASVHCLGKSRYPDARAMIDAGLGVVLATDFNPGSSPTPSMPFVLNLACTQMGMSPAEAVVASTINPAYSLGLGDEIGTIEVGKSADFVVFDLDDPAEIPYWVGAPMIHAVYRAGAMV